MNMDIAAAVVTVRVRADQSLVPGKKALGKFSAERLRFLTGQTAFRYVLRIETDDVMMGFDFAARLVFVKIRVEHFAFLIKRKGIAVHSVEIILFTQHAISVFIPERPAAVLVVLEDQILQRFSIVRAFRGQVFENCHDSHRPKSKPLFASASHPPRMR